MFGLEAGIFQSLLAGSDRPVDDGLNKLFELLAVDLAQVALAAGKFYLELRGRLRGERDLCLNDTFANGLHGFGVAAKVETEITERVVKADGDEKIIDIVAAEMGVAVGGDDFEDSVVQLQDGNVEGASAEIVDSNDSVLLLIEAVSERRGRWFIDQAQNFETGDAACIFRGLALRVVEICRDGDHRFANWRCEETLRIALELAQDESRDFGRGKSLIAQLDAEDFARL